jgi:hypothetical protein
MKKRIPCIPRTIGLPNSPVNQAPLPEVQAVGGRSYHRDMDRTPFGENRPLTRLGWATRSIDTDGSLL